MRRILTRLALTGVLTTGAVVAVQAPAHATWYYHSGFYPTATSCWYAGRYTAQVLGWEEYDCWKSSGPVWALMYWVTD